jgi:hypothetical protein
MEKEDYNINIQVCSFIQCNCLDPEFRNDNHFTNKEAMAALKSAFNKIFHTFPDRSVRCVEALNEYRNYKDKVGEWSLDATWSAADVMRADDFWRIYCAFSPLLQYAATRILEQVCSNSASERNWKDYKLVSSKARSQLSVDKVKMLIKVHNGLKIEQADLESWRGEMMKWTEADEMCKLNLSLVQAAAIVALRFKNWIEDEWEFQAIITKNNATIDALSVKYKFLYFLDPDGDDNSIEVRRIVDIEWQLRGRMAGAVSKYNVVTQLVLRNEEVVAEDEDYVPYEINDALHNMIRGAGLHNINYVMVQKE